MLSDFQQNILWESWLGAEIRAAYFAELVQRFQVRQRLLTVGGLLLTSGATISLVTTIVPANLSWIKPVLTVLAAALSLWSLVAKYERSSIDCADLHARWNTLAFGCEALWADMYSENAPGRLQQLRAEELAISKSSTAQPSYVGLLEKVQNNVLMHHKQQLAG